MWGRPDGDQVMAVWRRTSRRPRTEPTTLIVVDAHDPTRFVLRPNRIGVRVLANLRATSLDRQLAAGRAPESSRLLAARAQKLVSPRMRRKLVGDWERVVDLARHSPPVHCPHVPVCRRGVVAAEPELNEMLSFLLAPRPTAVRGVAMVRVLLCNGAGPLFNRHAPIELSVALRQATESLDPSTALAAWA
jgi:hypothetical protein